MIGKLSTCDCIIDTDKLIIVSRCGKHEKSEYGEVVYEHKKIQFEKIRLNPIKRLKRFVNSF